MKTIRSLTRSLYTPREVADILCCTEGTLIRWRVLFKKELSPHRLLGKYYYSPQAILQFKDNVRNTRISSSSNSSKIQEYLTVNDVSEQLSCSRWTLYGWNYKFKKELKPKKIDRQFFYDTKDVTAFSKKLRSGILGTSGKFRSDA